VFIDVCLYVYIYIYMDGYMNYHSCVCMCVFLSVRVRLLFCLYVRVCKYIRTYMCVCVCALLSKAPVMHEYKITLLKHRKSYPPDDLPMEIWKFGWNELKMQTLELLSNITNKN
jgi:hypothetical protein